MVDESPDSDADEAVLEESTEIAAALDAEGGDDGTAVHDAAVSNSIRTQAIAMMREQGVVMDPVTEKAALTIIPRVCQISCLCCLHI